MIRTQSIQFEFSFQKNQTYNQIMTLGDELK